MNMLMGVTMTLVKVEEVKTIRWKQGSFFGYGGDKSQEYHECTYQIQGGKIPVYIQVGLTDATQSLKVDHDFQFGMQNGVIFLVLHDRNQTPYQHRFMMNPKQQWLSNANEILKLKTDNKVDLAWIAGDYLRNFD